MHKSKDFDIARGLCGCLEAPGKRSVCGNPPLTAAKLVVKAEGKCRKTVGRIKGRHDFEPFISRCHLFRFSEFTQVLEAIKARINNHHLKLVSREIWI